VREGRTYAPWDSARAASIIEPLARLPGGTLPVLHALQAEFGYVAGDAIALVADALNLSRAEVVGVVNFYHDFRQDPPAAHLLQVCRAESCQAMGCEPLFAELQDALGPAHSQSDLVALQAVYCLGNCALSPAAMVDGRLVGRATADRLLRMIEGT
jgi:formate dehydrogenase subunit gamma